MRMRNVELMVGGFMVMGIVALVLMALRVSGLSIAAGETYTIKVRFENLGDRPCESLAGGCHYWPCHQYYSQSEWYAPLKWK